MDGALASFYSFTGVQLPIEAQQYQNLVFVAGSVELLGGLLFILNVKLGAMLLVSRGTVAVVLWWLSLK